MVSDCCMLKSVLVPSLLHFTQFCQSSFFINLSNSYCNTINIAYNNYNDDDIQWQDYIAINIILTLNPKHSTVPATKKKVNSVPAETRTISTPYSIPFTLCPDPTLSNTFSINHHHLSCLLIYTHRYHSRGLWAISIKCLLSSFSP